MISCHPRQAMRGVQLPRKSFFCSGSKPDVVAVRVLRVAVHDFGMLFRLSHVVEPLHHRVAQARRVVLVIKTIFIFIGMLLNDVQFLIFPLEVVSLLSHHRAPNFHIKLIFVIYGAALLLSTTSVEVGLHAVPQAHAAGLHLLVEPSICRRVGEARAAALLLFTRILLQREVQVAAARVHLLLVALGRSMDVSFL